MHGKPTSLQEDDDEAPKIRLGHGRKSSNANVHVPLAQWGSVIRFRPE